MVPLTISRLLKNAHLWRCAASLVNRHTSMYASFLSFCAPYIWTFLNSLFKIEFFNKLLDLPLKQYIPHFSPYSVASLSFKSPEALYLPPARQRIDYFRAAYRQEKLSPCKSKGPQRRVAGLCRSIRYFRKTVFISSCLSCSFRAARPIPIRNS